MTGGRADGGAGEGRDGRLDLSVGDEGTELVVEALDRTDFVRYAGASGDFTPLHFDDGHARESGYDGVFAQGMFVAGVASRFVTDWVGIERVRRFRTRFEDQVWPDERVVVTGRVTDRRRDGEDLVVDLEFEVTTGDGRRVLTGEATAVDAGGA